MQTNVVGTKIHTHLRAKSQYSNGHTLLETSNVVDYTPSAAIESFKADYPLIKYTQSYSKDVNGNTEYIVLTGTNPDGFRLTIHSFSCYCEPLNENQQPPF